MAFAGDVISLSGGQDELRIEISGPRRKCDFVLVSPKAPSVFSLVGSQWELLGRFDIPKETLLETISACESVIDVDVIVNSSSVRFDMDGEDIRGSVGSPTRNIVLSKDKLRLHYPRFYINRFGPFLDMATSDLTWRVLVEVWLSALHVTVLWVECQNHVIVSFLANGGVLCELMILERPLSMIE